MGKQQSEQIARCHDPLLSSFHILNDEHGTSLAENPNPITTSSKNRTGKNDGSLEGLHGVGSFRL